ncbi:putative DNA polymerase III, delta' subunit [Waddlia chondrophila 2032/99]|uniref:Putative DNA polymerase III, delta' subunit n=2 Tax=Waddlia chondrophila TaxID=71667 RepID=D6YW63_WADCW|nr:DNA polymerase III, delta' subunit [Waddlia chondrophila]ADI38374.1 putative DNA polymerase III, delta' subunit [Waddlia chondrophila WSU 86-1044]CCB91461.1 putative DNA polymerase III, delta' subunit [Waddlia chondrophila 2032/99]
MNSKLHRLIEMDRIPHSLLLIGSDKATLKETALSFARSILKTDRKEHPDIRLYMPEGKVGLHSIFSMRKFSEEVYLSPFESLKKVFILLEAERMLPTSANALLKTFEEPAPDSVIILATSSPSQLLPTVLSRCQKVTIDKGNPQIVKEDPLYKALITALAHGSLKSYANILELSDQLDTLIDEEHKEMEKSLKTELIDHQADMLTAAQKEAFLKEVEGVVSLSKKERVKKLLIALLSWYRDLHLLKVKGNPALLMNSDFESELAKAACQKQVPLLSDVEQIMRDAILSLDRSTSPKICFENVFLRLT